MEICIRFREDEARAVRLFLADYYGKNKNTALATLAKMAIRTVVAIQAQKELDEAIIEVRSE